MSTFWIKPAPGKLVRDPATLQPLPEGGVEKPKSPHWRRRVKDGDVIEIAPPAEETGQ